MPADVALFVDFKGLDSALDEAKQLAGAEEAARRGAEAALGGPARRGDRALQGREAPSTSRPPARAPSTCSSSQVDDAAAAQGTLDKLGDARRRALAEAAGAGEHRRCDRRRSSRSGRRRRSTTASSTGSSWSRTARPRSASLGRVERASRRLAGVEGRDRRRRHAGPGRRGSSTPTCRARAAAREAAGELVEVVRHDLASRCRRRRSRPRRRSATALLYGSVDGDVLPLKGFAVRPVAFAPMADPRVPLHLRVRHRGPSRQDGRPDLGLDPRRRPRRGPARARRLRDAGHDRPRRRRRRDHDRDLRRHPAARPPEDPRDRLRPREVRLRRRDLRRDRRARRAVARHRAGRRRLLRGAARPGRRRPARPGGRRRPGDDVRLRDRRDATS